MSFFSKGIENSTYCAPPHTIHIEIHPSLRVLFNISFLLKMPVPLSWNTVVFDVIHEGRGGAFAIPVKLLCLLPGRQNEEYRRMVLEFWWFLRELCRAAKVDRGKEHSLLMHQCTTEVLCNLAGLTFGLAFHPSSCPLKTIAFQAKQVFSMCHFENFFFFFFFVRLSVK